MAVNEQVDPPETLPLDPRGYPQGDPLGAPLGDVRRRAGMHAALGEPVRLRIVDHLALGDASPGELGSRFAMPTNLLAHHLKVLDEAGLIRRVRSEGDRRRQYVQLRLDDPTVAALTRTPASWAHGHAGAARPERVVFVCTANSARSQLARAAWRRVSDLPALSGGTHPAERVHPAAVRTGQRHGLDLTGATTARIDDIAGPDDLLVAVCDNAHEELSRTRQLAPGSTERPEGDGGRRSWLHWHIADPVPAGSEEAFETAYAEITERVGRLAVALVV